MKTPERIIVGTIVGSVGLRGEVRIKPDTDFPERFAKTEELLASHPSGRSITLHPLRARMQKENVVMQCLEFKTIDEAKLWQGSILSITPEQLMPLGEEQFYIFQIIGLQVYDEQGEHLGEVTDVLKPGANDVYVVSLTEDLSKRYPQASGELLIPVIDKVVLITDIEQNKLIVRLMEGLLA